MKKLALFLLLFPLLSFAQTPGPFSITSSQCATIGVGRGVSLVALQVTGTWSGTLQPQGVIQGQAAFNVQVMPAIPGGPQGTLTANGTFVASVAGYDYFQLCGNTVSSGTAVVWLNDSLVPQSVLSPAISATPAPALSAPGSLQTPLTASNTGAATAITASLAGTAGKTTYITGFQVTGAGATGASVVTVTVTGTISGTMSYNIAVPAGVTTGITPLIVTFPIPVPASAINTAVVVNVPSLGAGNTNAAVAAQGFQQ